MQFYYVQDVYHKTQLEKKIRLKVDTIPQVNIIRRKESAVSANKAGGSGGHCEPLSKGFKGRNPLRKFLGSKEHLDWLKIDLNVTEISTVEDYKHIKI